MIYDIRAIETKYKGFRFRSRTEARWAVFFDAAGIRWEYEPEGYVLQSGPYLPDFWLPSFSGGMFVEVKPIGGDFSKAMQLGRETKRLVWLAEGPPDVRCYTVYFPPDDEATEYCALAVPCADQARDENRMYWMPGYENADGTFDEKWHECLGDKFLNAVEKSRSARFDIGGV